jgi:tetratricopeptide (TPR) repeat protein
MALHMRCLRAEHGLCRLLQSARVLSFLLATLLTNIALAQGSHETALARALFEEGVALADAGDWAAAADRFARAYELKPTSGIAFNWASALSKTGKLVQASELLQGVVRDPVAAPELKQDSEQKLRALSPRIAHLKLSVDRELAAAGTVSVDGKEWPTAVWDVASPVDPGQHVASCANDRGELARVEIELGEGEQKDVLLTTRSSKHEEAAEDGSAAPAAGGSTRDQPRRLYKSWILWTAVGVAVVGGAIAIAVTSSKGDERTEPMAQGNTGTGVIRW